MKKVTTMKALPLVFNLKIFKENRNFYIKVGKVYFTSLLIFTTLNHKML